jgi:hypothetical protein
MKKLIYLFAIFFIALSINSCNKDNLGLLEGSVDALNTTSYVTTPVYCGGPVQFPLKGGSGAELIYTGSVSVANDKSSILIEVISLKGFQNITGGSIDVGFYKSVPPQVKPVPDNFDYHFTPTEGPNVYGYYVYNLSIPLNGITFEDDAQIGLSCGQPVYIVVHVDAIMELIPGVLTSEDAWGGNIVVAGYSTDGSLWQYKYLNYSSVCCIVCDGETAWANGNPYPGSSWALYSPYTSGATKTVDLLAGQHEIAGSVTIKPSSSGRVTIIIDLNEAANWSLQDVSSAVKIQGYSSAPTVEPIPGRFNTYKGNLLEVTVPYFAYYGIHLDVQQCGF